MGPMNIGCDGRALVGPRTGVGIWTEQIMGGLAESGINRVFLAASKAVSFDSVVATDNLCVVPPPRWPTLGPVWLNTIVPRLARELQLDIWIGSLAILPWSSPVPTVAMVHDLTPRTHPQLHTAANRTVFRLFLKRSLKTANTVVAGSDATRNEILSVFPWAESKLVRIGYGVDEWYSPAPAGDDGKGTRERFAGGRPYVLHLGTIEPRKGIIDLVQAWERLNEGRAEGPDLVIAGKTGWHTDPILDRIKRSPLAPRIHLPGYVSRDDARDLLRHAAVFALASEAEGFGLPLAEAVSCGIPAVASDIPVLEEAGGDAAIYCPVNDPDALAAGLVEVLDPVVATRLRERARKRAPELRWGPVFQAWAELLAQVADSSRS